MPTSTDGNPITFLVPGSVRDEATRGARVAPEPPLPGGLTRGRVKTSVSVSAQRGGGGEVRVTAVPGEDVVVLHLGGGGPGARAPPRDGA